jgi:hypothetical protein
MWNVIKWKQNLKEKKQMNTILVIIWILAFPMNRALSEISIITGIYFIAQRRGTTRVLQIGYWMQHLKKCSYFHSWIVYIENKMQVEIYNETKTDHKTTEKSTRKWIPNNCKSFSHSAEVEHLHRYFFSFTSHQNN